MNGTWKKLVFTILTILGVGAGSVLWNHETRVSKNESTLQIMSVQINDIHEFLLSPR